MPIIDFHTHILPQMDDGSKDLDTSCGMCRLSAAQGVGIIVATPHFYASRDRVETFLLRRQEACEKLRPHISAEGPKLRLGAEVAFFPGISQADKIGQLTVEGTNVLLLELPFAPWNSAVVNEVRILAEERGFSVLLAHMERYFKVCGDRRNFEAMLELPVRVQINAGSLLDWKLRGRVIKLFRTGQAHFLGSDCHGLRRRPPNLEDGRGVLEKKLGSEFLAQMDLEGTRFLGI